MASRSLPALALVCVLAAPCLGAERGDAAPDAREAVRAGNAFALRLYARLKDAPGNLFLSPYSLSSALAMTYLGARGDTQQAMAGGLGYPFHQEGRAPGRPGGTELVSVPPTPKHMAQTFAALRRAVVASTGAGCELRVANALWGQQGEPFRRDFLDLTRTHFGAGFRQVDFQNAAEAARAAINRWTAEHTKGKIPELVPKGALDSATTLALTNAIYFKGDWQVLFDKNRTSKSPFTLLDGKRVDVPTMHLGNQLGYVGTPEVQALELLYAGRDLSMILLLPRTHDGLPALEKALTPDFLAKLLARLRKHKVLLALPRFKLASRFQLGRTLAALGMANAFSGDDANFSGINGKRNLFLDEVIHHAVVEVNERGTEAAGATAVLVKKNGGSGPARFRADHPFLFLIRHKPTGSILFLGRVADPAAVN